MAVIVDRRRDGRGVVGAGSVRAVNTFGRRTFLIRSSLIGAGAVSLAACGGSDGGSDGGSEDYILAQRFSQEVNVPGLQRLPFSLADKQTLLSTGPTELSGEVRDSDDNVIIPSITAKRRTVSNSIAYWDFHPQLDEPGFYTLFIDGGDPGGGAIQINDPSTVLVPYVGQPLPPFDTPTSSNPAGVSPICTRLEGGPCPFHEISLTDALASGKPVAYLIGTPAHCQFGTCAPGLEFLIAASNRVGDRMIFVHAEVYTDDTASESTPAVQAYDLSFEPALWLTDKKGTIVIRLDAAWDQTELDENIDRILAG